MENILLATELINGYNWKSVSTWAMLKVDLRKAFDSVKWDFVILSMRAMNFPDSFINLVHQCISTMRFSVAINGELCGFFKGSGGLRQGDPLSPYIFCDCTGGLLSTTSFQIHFWTYWLSSKCH